MIADFLAHDDKLNHTEFPTEDKAPPSANTNISVKMLSAPPQDTFHFYQDDDSVSTFTQSPTQPTFGLSPDISRIFHPQLLVHTPSTQPTSGSSSSRGPSRIPSSINQMDDCSMSKILDTESRMSDIKYSISKLSLEYKTTMQLMKQQSKKLSQERNFTQATLDQILHLLQKQHTTDGNTARSDQANHLQGADAGDPTKAAGLGS